MTVLTIIVGIILIATGVVGYIATDSASMTALIPSAVGALILVCGLIALNPKVRKHALHASLAIALLGAIGSLMNVVKIGDLFAGTAERPAAIIASTILFVVAIIYIAFGVRSFIAARRYRAQLAAKKQQSA